MKPTVVMISSHSTSYQDCPPEAMGLVDTLVQIVRSLDAPRPVLRRRPLRIGRFLVRFTSYRLAFAFARFPKALDTEREARAMHRDWERLKRLLPKWVAEEQEDAEKLRLAIAAMLYAEDRSVSPDYAVATVLAALLRRCAAAMEQHGITYAAAPHIVLEAEPWKATVAKEPFAWAPVWDAVADDVLASDYPANVIISVMEELRRLTALIDAGTSKGHKVVIAL